MKVNCPAKNCGALIEISKICPECGAELPIEFYNKAQTAENTFLEIQEMITELKMANNSIIIDLEEALSLYERAKTTRGVLADFKYHDLERYNKLNDQIQIFYTKYCEVKQSISANNALKNWQEEDEKKEKIDFEVVKNKNEAENSIHQIEKRKIGFSVIYFSISFILAITIFLLKYFVSPEIIHDVLIGFFGLAGAVIGYGSGGGAGCFGGLVVGALFGLFVNWLMTSIAGNIVFLFILIVGLIALYKYLIKTYYYINVKLQEQAATGKK